LDRSHGNPDASGIKRDPAKLPGSAVAGQLKHYLAFYVDEIFDFVRTITSECAGYCRGSGSVAIT